MSAGIFQLLEGDKNWQQHKWFPAGISVHQKLCASLITTDETVKSRRSQFLRLLAEKVDATQKFLRFV